MNSVIPHHLSKEEIIKLGAFYTPEEIVQLVLNFIYPYFEKNSNVIVLDSSAGYGAFLRDVKKKGIEYRAGEYDKKAIEVLKSFLDEEKIFNTNALTKVSRKKYEISEDDFLIVVGNPPYNDITSEYKKGKKGEINCDIDLFDRDIGISFLKSYNKLRADIVSVLHPLSYLIKEANFKRLKDFKNNYRLIRGVIFPSSMFYGTSPISAFPVLVSLYERNVRGMDFDYVRNFSFNILGSSNTFTLSDYTTTDGYIDKYPPGKHDIKESPIGLYFHTFRDINSLKRNAAFMLKKTNGIVVTVENFYKYAYLYAFKKLFKPENAWLFGNLSPLVEKDFVESNKKLFVLFALKTNQVVRNLNAIDNIMEYYQISSYDLENYNIEILEKEISAYLQSLIKPNRKYFNYNNLLF
jgi:hypothetical protein